MANSLTGDWIEYLKRLRPATGRHNPAAGWLRPLAPSSDSSRFTDAAAGSYGPFHPYSEWQVRPYPHHPSLDELPGTWESHTLKLAPQRGELIAQQLSYQLYVPYSPPRAAMPVVVMLHGCRQSSDEFAGGTRMNALAEDEGFIVAYPQQPMHRQPQRCWHWFDLAAGEGGREVVAVASLLDELAARPDVRADCIYLAGLSAGAAMAAVVALRHPDKVAAVGLHSGVVIGAADSPRSGLHAMRSGSTAEPAWLLDAAGVTPGGPEVPAIVLHGLEDDAVNPINGRLLARQFLAYNKLSDPAALGTPPSLSALPVGNYAEARYGRWGRDLVRLVEVAGLGHAWSGGNEHFRYHSGVGPDASRLMWDFFSRHRRRSSWF